MFTHHGPNKVRKRISAYFAHVKGPTKAFQCIVRSYLFKHFAKIPVFVSQYWANVYLQGTKYCMYVLFEVLDQKQEFDISGLWDMRN